MLGALLGWYYNRWADRSRNPARSKQLGVLTASGLIVGESLFGVVLAGLIVATNRAAPLALVGDAFAAPATAIGTIAFVLVVLGLYVFTARLGAANSKASG